MQFLVVTNLGQAQWSLRSRPRSAKSQDYAVSCSYKPGISQVALPRAKIHAVSCSDKLGTSPVELAV